MIAVQDKPCAQGSEQAANGTGGAHRQMISAGQEDGAAAGETGDQIEEQVASMAPHGFHAGAKHVQGKHVEQDVQKAAMDKAVRQKPPPLVEDHHLVQAQRPEIEL